MAMEMARLTMMYRFELRDPDILVVSPTFGMNLSTASNFYRAVTDLIMRTKPKYLLVDMVHIPIIQSLDLGVLGALYKYMKSLNGEMAICCCHKGVMESLKLSGMSGVLR
jgi:anti-anti-sigma factor